MNIVITGGAGYIGSKLTGFLLCAGHDVTIIDKMMFGGEHMLPYVCFGSRFNMIAEDILEADLASAFSDADVVIHLAALVGFPICQQVGSQVARAYNVDGTKRVYGAACESMVPRIIFASTYSNYGLSLDNSPVTEESPLNPQSLYAETKIEAERFLLDHKDDICKPLIFRFATLFGTSPRTRFDLIINQFVLDAITKGKITIYQRDYRRSFCHIFDIIRAIAMVLEWPSNKFDGQIYNVGSDSNNLSKEQVITKIKSIINVEVEYKDLSFGGDMRDITVSFAKIKCAGFDTIVDVDDGIKEIIHIIKSGIIKDPYSDKYRNAQFIVN
jgi:nucleoside-diphosphate-sugar epimerase